MARIINNQHFDNLQGLTEYVSSLSNAERAKRKGEIALVNKPNNEGLFMFNSNLDIIQLAESTGTTVHSDVVNYLVNEGYITKEYVDNSIANLIDSADEAFNTLRKLQDMILLLSAMTSTVHSSDHIVVTKSEYEALDRLGELKADVFYCIIEDESSGSTPSGGYNPETQMFEIEVGSVDAEGYATIEGVTVDTDGYFVFDGVEGGGGESGDTGDDAFENPDDDGYMPTNPTLSPDGQYFVFDNLSVSDDGYFVSGGSSHEDSGDETDNPRYENDAISLDNAGNNNDALVFSNASINNNNELIIG